MYGRPSISEIRSTGVPKGRQAIATGVSPWFDSPGAISPGGAEEGTAPDFRPFGASRRHARLTRGSRRGLLTSAPSGLGGARRRNGRFASLALLLVTSAALAAEPPDLPKATKGEITPALRDATARGLKWLAEHQAPDGSYGRLSHYGPHVGLTGLAGLAFMSDGNVPGRGVYGENVDRCVSFILAHGSESGLLAAETSHGPMYGHGFATLFLAEVYGMSPDPDLRETVRKAIRLIVNSRNDEGGWRYYPVRNDADISVTVCQIMALRAARNSGVYVAKSVIDDAIEYVRKSQNPDGGFRYMLGNGSSEFARSAGGVAALQYGGVYGGDVIENGLAYLLRFTPPRDQSVSHYFYGHYYAAQAMFLAGDQYWRIWFPAVREELLAKQDPEGFWRGQAGNEYGTAMALIILQIPNRLLPIFQK